MTNGIPLGHFLFLAAGLFGIGLFGVLARKNAIAVLMGIELMLNAVNINLLAFAKARGDASLSGPVFAVFVIAVAAAEAAVALSIVIAMHRRFRSANVDEVNHLKG
jgi:NADH:ubiquinone oxidoreductase subunit K